MIGRCDSLVALPPLSNAAEGRHLHVNDILDLRKLRIRPAIDQPCCRKELYRPQRGGVRDSQACHVGDTVY